MEKFSELYDRNNNTKKDALKYDFVILNDVDKKNDDENRKKPF